MSEELNLFQINGMLAFIASLVVTRLLISAHLNDAPDDARKMHQNHNATAGGLAIILGFCAALVSLNHQMGLVESKQILFVVGLSLALGLVGLLDDIFTMKSHVRMAILVIIIGLLLKPEFVTKSLPIFPGMRLEIGMIFGFFGSFIWLMLMVNAVNFMDGANGVAFGAISISFIGLGALCFFHGEIGGAAMCFLATAAIWGFLTYNVGKGNIFAGDVGSWFVGGLYGALGLLAARSGVNIFAVALCALPILADVILTILHRIILGENILSAHNRHIYQRIIKTGKSHFYTALLLWVQTQICIAAAIAGDKFAQNYQAAIFAMMVVIYIVIFAILRPRLEAKII
jgi:UDP-N-acetylmuramyl pentapeptide phosphotransferase/UDP-N-acetylglucosamine-1-phosphate transferase